MKSIKLRLWDPLLGVNLVHFHPCFRFLTVSGCFCLNFIAASGDMRSLLNEGIKQIVWARSSFNSSSPGMMSLIIWALVRKSVNIVKSVPSASLNSMVLEFQACWVFRDTLWVSRDTLTNFTNFWICFISAEFTINSVSVLQGQEKNWHLSFFCFLLFTLELSVQ